MEDIKCLICIQLLFPMHLVFSITSYSYDISLVLISELQIFYGLFCQLIVLFLFVIGIRQLSMVGYQEIFLIIYPANL
jgi:hypothetical protein